jgi:small nuclear ribonucleoprotein B and B'
MNLVLADTEEFRKLRKRKQVDEDSEEVVTHEEKRTLGLTIIRGAQVVSIEAVSPPAQDPSARLGKSAPGGLPGLPTGPGVARPAGRGAGIAPSLAVSGQAAAWRSNARGADLAGVYRVRPLVLVVPRLASRAFRVVVLRASPVAVVSLCVFWAAVDFALLIWFAAPGAFPPAGFPGAPGQFPPSFPGFPGAPGAAPPGFQPQPRR